jgi:HSP20 family molecular chaperone IbpA
MSKIDSFFIGGDKLFQEFFGNNTSADSFPRFNVWQNTDESEYHVDLALPGWSKDDLKVSFENGVLTVSGCKQEATGVKYLHKGLSGKGFKRSFLVPLNLEVNCVALKDGLLSVTFLKRAENPTKLIEIK